jgi:short-subunit dehydrogenase
MQTLNAKNCLLTGATGGLGKELAAKLVINGCNLFLTARNEKKLNKLTSLLQKQTENKIKIYYKSADLSKSDDVKDLIKYVKKKFNSIDILINCAGVFQVNFLKDTNLADFEKSFNVNMKAPFMLCKEFSQDMIKKRWGKIVNIGSSSSYNGYKKTSIYCATKHALLGFSRSLVDELKKYNVRTFCVSPGSIKTNMAKKLVEQDFDTFLDPKEVAEAILFVISHDNEMMIDELKLNRKKIE